MVCLWFLSWRRIALPRSSLTLPLLYAVFWNAESQAVCKKHLMKAGIDNDYSDRVVYCDHSTVKFNVSEEDLERYSVDFGKLVTFYILGYAKVMLLNIMIYGIALCFMSKAPFI
jgi:hypothetical protein